MGMTEQEAIEELKNYRACSGTQLPEEMEVAITGKGSCTVCDGNIDWSKKQRYDGKVRW